ncbi:hypothetical protein N7534_012065 [Penicillium rubens]|nr:hypothetical protein N7534_012065 [Penicillium rubens]
MAIYSATSETFYAEGYGEVAIDLAELDLNQSLFDHQLSERIRIGGMILDKQLAATGTVSTTFYKDYTEMKSLTTSEIKAYATVENN